MAYADFPFRSIVKCIPANIIEAIIRNMQITTSVKEAFSLTFIKVKSKFLTKKRAASAEIAIR